MWGLPLLFRAVLADVSSVTTVKACSHLHLLLSTILDYMPLNTTEVALSSLTFLVVIVVVVVLASFLGVFLLVLRIIRLDLLLAVLVFFMK